MTNDPIAKRPHFAPGESPGVVSGVIPNPAIYLKTATQHASNAPAPNEPKSKNAPAPNEPNFQPHFMPTRLKPRAQTCTTKTESSQCRHREFGKDLALASVRLDNITRHFKSRGGSHRAVESLNLDIADGELLVLVGPSGCGKTTTLRIVAGLDDPTEGEVYIDKRDVTRVAPKDRNVAMVFQDNALYPHMTVYKNMAFGLKMRGAAKSEIDQFVRDAAQKLGLSELLDRKPSALSGGERQRVALGRAIVRRPSVFLLDEPLSNLDARLRTQMRTEIKTLHRDLNATMIHVTHDQEEAMTLGMRIAVMRDGKLQQCGKPLNVYHEPANTFVASSIGSPQINLVTGTLSREDGSVCFTAGQSRFPLPAKTVSCLSSANGSDVILGVRPEDISLRDHRDAPSTTARITLTEPMGDRTIYHCDAGDIGPLVISARSSETWQVNDNVTLEFNLDRAHFFRNSGRGECIA